VFGYELDTTTLSTDERREVAEQVAFYVAHRELLQRGRFIRLRSPFEGDGNEAAWMCVSDDARQAVVGFYQALNRPAPGAERLPLRGLDASLDYRVTVWPAVDDTITRMNSLVRGGDDLMNAGLLLDGSTAESVARGDFWARLFILEVADPPTATG
jgi:alpha-galactosidase